jgi:hypothetical protein
MLLIYFNNRPDKSLIFFISLRVHSFQDTKINTGWYGPHFESSQAATLKSPNAGI